MATDKIKLSEAMRRGAAIRPQCSGAFFNKYGESCAIGAALEGAEFLNPETYHNATTSIFLEKFFKDLPVPRFHGWKCPGDSHPTFVHSTIANIIMCLNDDCHWTREQIADWLESIGL